MTGTYPAGVPAPGPAGQWLRNLTAPARRTGEPAVRLLCFPHAAGGASAFRPWRDLLPPECELWAVQYPGHEDRIGERPASDLTRTARQAAIAAQWLADRPYLVFGHSMGALLAYETCRRLERLGIPAPDRLFVSGSPPPHRVAGAPSHTGDGPRWMHGYEHGAGSEAGPDDEQYDDLTARTLEADLRMLAGYRPGPAWRAPWPVTVIRAAHDPDLDAAAAAAWQDYAADDITQATVPGDHFACFTRPHDTVRLIAGAVRR
ncbi:oleoyl-ACP hydrolase [Streptomyces chrestomyceticus JCM 4735]|uniref:Oleoyl-ACP hydrolase n=1 Tax=Streptomyces chrestomyceticus JCM 4735 TaxID=1306181 RepID=A0A7U9L650_9ACTN|nr:alpha/beta fold hydrolase [Streptomyces chrestomyceticus]GCD40326.1 oleoyl-ACP hydrolase [Streptomyces chrestomyceticus JCM 4735]